MADIQVPTIATVTPASGDTVLGVQGGVVKRMGAGPSFAQLAADSGADLVGFVQPGAGAVARTVRDKSLELPATPQDFGADPSSPAGHQAAIDALIASSHKLIRFPVGVWRAYINNSTSDRTFIFDEGAIIDGAVHLAIGAGPESAAALAPVRNVRAIGTLVATVRVGTYYCDGVNVDKIRITEVNAGYSNQTTEGGTKGVHLYYGSKNIKIGEIVFDSATASAYALGIDTSTIHDADHYPTDISIGKVTAPNGTAVSFLRTSRTRNLEIGEMVLRGYTALSGNCCECVYDDGLKIGRIVLDGAGHSTAGLSGLYLNNNASADIGEVVAHHFTGIGVYTNTSPNVRIGKVTTYANGLDGTRLLSQASVGELLSYSNASAGLQVTSPATGVRIGKLRAYDNGTQGIYNNAAHDTSIDEIDAYSHTGASGFSVFVNNSQRFRCKYLKAANSVQGLRYIGNTDCDLGVIYCTGNSSADVALSGANSGLSFHYAKYTTISGGTLQAVPGFRGRLIPAGDKVQGDADVTLTPGVDVVTHRFDTPLTVNRTITLGTAGAQPGDRFRVVRTAASTGAFNLAVGAVKTLATGQWCDVEWTGTTWALTASGSL